MSSMPLQSAIYDVLLCPFIYLCFLYVLRFYISNLTSRPVFARTGKGKKTDHIPKTSPRSRGIRILYAFFVCFSIAE